MPSAPPPGLTGWQVVAFFAITAGVALVQTWFQHRKIDAAVASTKTPATPASEENKP